MSSSGAHHGRGVATAVTLQRASVAEPGLLRLLADRRASKASGLPLGSGRRRHTTDQARAQIYEDAIAIVAVDFARKLTARDVARRVATSPRQLQRAFQENGGSSFRTHLAQIRMAHARSLVETTDLSVREIADRVGYREPSQFTKAFKRAHGITPTEARRTGQLR